MRSKSQTFCRRFRDLLSVFALLVLALPAYAVQGSVGTSVNLSGGGSNRVQNPTSAVPAGNSLSTGFYAAYSSLSINSMRPTSSLTGNYGFGYNRTIGSSGLPTGSHTASLNFTSQLSPRWTARLSDSFRMTDGLGTFNALSGVPQPSSNSAFSFQSVGGRRQPRTNDLDANFDWLLDATSNLSFSAKHSIRSYGGGTPTNSFISDQQQLAGSVAYQQKLGATESWGLSWKATYFDYGNSQRTISQSGQADYTVGIARNVSLQIGAGLSQVNSRGTSGGKLNYDALFGLTRVTTAQAIALTFSQNSSDRLGLGSTAVTRRGNLTWRRPIGKMTASLAISAHKSQGTLSNSLNVKGVTGDVNLGYQLTTRLSASVGANVRNTGTGAFGFSQKRAFYSASLAYSITTTVFISGGATFDTSRQSGLFNSTQRRVFVSLRYTEPNLIRFR